MNSYELSRSWFDFCFENPSRISSHHSALYFFCIEHCNRLGWKKHFGLPTTMAKEAIGIRSYNTYIKTLNDLISFGFIQLIEKSKNQYSSNIIALSNFNKALDKALDKALIKHATKQSESTRQSIDSIDKQYNKEQLNQLTKNHIEVKEYLKTLEVKDDTFNEFWESYHEITLLAKTDKDPTNKYWKRLSVVEKRKAVEKIKLYYNSLTDKKHCKKARTYLSDKNFNDEFATNFRNSIKNETTLNTKNVNDRWKQ